MYKPKKLIKMYIDKIIVRGTNFSQIAWPVGPNKDSYNINSWFRQDIETEEIVVRHELVKNFVSDTKRETLFEGSYKECVQYFKDNILTTDKEWIRDAKGNLVYPTE